MKPRSASHRWCMGLRLLIIAFAAFLIVGCRSGNRAKNQQANKSDANHAQDAGNVAIKTSLKKAEMTWIDTKGNPILKAGFSTGKASQEDKIVVAQLRDMRAELYEKGKLASRMVAPRVEANTEAYEIVAYGGVKVTSVAQNASIVADKITWKSKENTIVGEGNIRLRKDNVTATGSKIISDTSLTKITLIDGEIYLE